MTISFSFSHSVLLLSFIILIFSPFPVVWHHPQVLLHPVCICVCTAKVSRHSVFCRAGDMTLDPWPLDLKADKHACTEAPSYTHTCTHTTAVFIRASQPCERKKPKNILLHINDYYIIFLSLDWGAIQFSYIRNINETREFNLYQSWEKLFMISVFKVELEIKIIKETVLSLWNEI